MRVARDFGRMRGEMCMKYVLLQFCEIPENDTVGNDHDEVWSFGLAKLCEIPENDTVGNDRDGMWSFVKM